MALQAEKAADGRQAQAVQGIDRADRRLRVGVPFAFSTHAELVWHWLLASGFAADEVEVRTVPPPRMAEALAAGEVDAACVGEPWASVAVALRTRSVSPVRPLTTMSAAGDFTAMASVQAACAAGSPPAGGGDASESPPA